MAGDEAENKLYDAATKGDEKAFDDLVQGDSKLLKRVSFSSARNLLHAAIIGKRVNIFEKVLEMNEQLVQDLDSKNSSSLHIAAAKGNVVITNILLEKAPAEMRWWRDCHDMNPIHIAAMKGNDGVLREMLRVDPLPAMERVHRGETVLHLCVKHRQFPALKVLLEKLEELVPAADENGDTILHLAVRSNQLEVIVYLAENTKLEMLTRNSVGKTALALLYDTPQETDDYRKVKKIFIKLSNQTLIQVTSFLTNNTMTVVALIATMAFQAAINPPGGVWQDNESSHKAGKAVMASAHPNMYKHFSRANTTAFVSSLIILILVIPGWTFASAFIMAITVTAMWVSMASIAVSYGVSLTMINSTTETQSIGYIVAIVVSVYLGVLAFVNGHRYGWYSIMKGKLWQWLDYLTSLNPSLRPMYQMLQRMDQDEYGNDIIHREL